MNDVFLFTTEPVEIEEAQLEITGETVSTFKVNERMLEVFIEMYAEYEGEEFWQQFAEENDIDLSELENGFIAKDFLYEVRCADKFDKLCNYINNTDGMHYYSSEIKAERKAGSDPYPFIEVSCHAVN